MSLLESVQAFLNDENATSSIVIDYDGDDCDVCGGACKGHLYDTATETYLPIGIEQLNELTEGNQ